MDQPISKACTKCREVKRLELFGRGQGRFGRLAQCRDCKRKPRKTPVRVKTDTHKECNRCSTVLPKAKFSLSSQSVDGLRGYCDTCNSERVRLWILANPEKVKRWRELNSEKLAEKSRNRRAQKMDARISNFTLHQLVQRAEALGDRCWMCGTSDWSHWDHVKPLSKGGAHCLANLRPACASCNCSKGAKWYGVGALDRFLLAT